jgi:hypothetical protein
MSLWTPSGEHPVERPGRSSTPSAPRTAPAPGAGDPTAGGTAGPDLDDLTPEERAQLDAMAEQVEEARRQLLSAPAGPVVGQQSLQFYELAALHLSQPEPRLDDARVAIDALAAVVDTLGARLGPAESPLRQALDQIRMAFVEVASRGGQAPAADGDA